MEIEQLIAKLDEHRAARRATSKLVESNKRVIAMVAKKNEDVMPLKEGLKAVYGIDVDDEKSFPVLKESFSWKSFKSELATQRREKFREADPSSAFAQFLRAGVQQLAADAFANTETTFEEWARVVPSSRKTELYAPSHGIGFPREIAEGQPYTETSAAALDLKLDNKKFGSMYSPTKELVDDDQTGQVRMHAQQLGEYLRLLNEVYVYGKLASVNSMKYAQLEIPTSETKPSYESNYPWSQALRGGGATRPATYGVLSQGNIQAGMIALGKQKNLQGLIMGVKANRLIISPKYQFDAAVLMNSAFYPSGAAGAGQVGGAFAVNPIKGLLDITVSQYVFDQNGGITGESKAWHLVDDKKIGMIVQQRSPVAVEQEAANSGKSFELDVYRFKANTRMNADFVDPRPFWQGSDGSV